MIIVICVYKEGKEEDGAGEVGREVVRRQKELCKLLFDTRFTLCIALLLLGMNICRLAENLYPHNVHRCSIEPEDIPFQGFEGGAIVAFLLQVRNHIFYSFCCQDVRGAQTDVVRGKIRQEVCE